MEKATEQIKKKERSKSVVQLDKNSINIIRTMQRNNIELKSIADNKANILLSLNGLMLTFLIPIVLSNLEIIKEYRLYIPLIIMSITCFSTILIAATILKPFNRIKMSKKDEGRLTSSPFFFVNFHKKPINEFVEDINRTIMDPKAFKDHVLADLYFIGKVLGVKYGQITICYNVFLVGLILTVLSGVVVILI